MLRYGASLGIDGESCGGGSIPVREDLGSNLIHMAQDGSWLPLRRFPKRHRGFLSNKVAIPGY
jgi:hypothetical protein